MSTKPEIVLVDWGIKQGSTVKNWKRRWFVLLSNGLLRYFVDKSVVDEQGSIQIDSNTMVILAPTKPEGIPVQIVTKSRTLTIAFVTSEIAEKWMNTINEIKSNLH